MTVGKKAGTAPGGVGGGILCQFCAQPGIAAARFVMSICHVMSCPSLFAGPGGDWIHWPLALVGAGPPLGGGGPF